jgi:aspartate aminotransferase
VNKCQVGKRMSRIQPSLTLAITARAKEMKRAGEQVWSFGAGEPDFDTPVPIKEKAKEALDRGETKYAPVAGLQGLCAAISAKLESENGLKYEPSRIVLSNGAKHSLFNVIMALCDEGDEIIIPGPYWLSYPEMVRIAGGTPVCVLGKDESGFRLSIDELESVVTPRTRAIIVNSPSNPTGIALGKSELTAIAEFATRHDLYIISDEIYEKLVYDGAAHVSIGSLSQDVFERTITVNGFSKAYAMTGWRLGYCAGPKDVIGAVLSLQSHSTSAPNTFAQFGAIEALMGGEGEVQDMVRSFAERRNRLYESVIAIAGVSCVKPMGAFYLFPNISSFGLDSVAFCRRLLEEQKVAVVPGLPFGADGNVRLSYACSMETIEKGTDGLSRFVDSL